MSSSISKKNKAASATKTILLSGFVAGTLDILAAILIYAVIMQKVTAVQILNGIASGAFGKTTVGSPAIMALMGLAFHFIIAFCFAIGYFIVYPYIPFLGKQKIIGGLLYGMFVWAVMNLVVVPMSNAYHAPFAWPSAIRAASILMICIGLPISVITSRYYSAKHHRE
jgi:uncharacterized membrane protein YagU involved in acid resistance